jgi:hypothetical protein
MLEQQTEKLRGARFFLVQYQNGENVPNDNKLPIGRKNSKRPNYAYTSIFYSKALKNIPILVSKQTIPIQAILTTGGNIFIKMKGHAVAVWLCGIASV